MIEIISDYNPTNGDKMREMVDSELAEKTRNIINGLEESEAI